MQNILARNLLFAAILILWSLFQADHVTLAAETNPLKEIVDAVEDGISETSRPVVDPNLFKEKQKKADPFFEKVRRKHTAFLKKEQERKKKFIEKLRSKDLPPEERQKRLAEFHNKESERTRKFYAKQRKKIDKHMEKENS